MKTTAADIGVEARNNFTTKWIVREGREIPETGEVNLGNDAVVLDAAVLYADLAGSTELLERFPESFTASAIKSFLGAICNVIKNTGGSIASFDGDRIMAVFIGDFKCSDSARAGLQIVQAVKVVNESLGNVYPARVDRLDFAVGIDVGKVFVVRTGIRDCHDLSWVGLPVNYAARLSKIRGRDEKVFITDRLFRRLNNNSRYGGNTQCMWVEIQTGIIPEIVWGSSWYWRF
jgi:class 3 adenylate cyclase